jgi:hypothetical protein
MSGGVVFAAHATYYPAEDPELGEAPDEGKGANGFIRLVFATVPTLSDTGNS